MLTSMRKFLLNGAFISAVLGFIPTIKRSQESRSRWATIANWILWGATVALAIAAVRDQAEDERELEA